MTTYRTHSAGILGAFGSLVLLACSGADDGAWTVDDLPEVAGQVESAANLDHEPIAGKELMVTDVSVVNSTKYTTYKPGKWNSDPDGGFSFGRLIDNMSTVEKPTDAARSNFVMSWLRLWETDQTVNGQVLAARPLIRDKVITPWKLASVGRNGNTSSHCDANPTTDFTCKLSFAADVVPFRLLSVVNRPDLRVVPSGSDAQTMSAGQGRFVLGVLDAARQPLQFVIIFEYMVPVSGKGSIQSNAQKWHMLGKEAFGSKYNEKLHEQTVSFTKWNAAPWRQNGSALLQIRTNEVAIAPAGSDPTNPNGTMWELREFILGPGGGLIPDTVKQEPPISLSGTTTLGDWASQNAAAILAGTHSVPATLASGEPFLAASSFTPFSGFSWQLPGVTEDVRSAFAINTCNGCHRSATSTSFLHVKNRQPTAPAVLSPFLTNELAANGPRINDFKFVLTTDFAAITDGPGKDGHDDADEDED